MLNDKINIRSKAELRKKVSKGFFRKHTKKVIKTKRGVINSDEVLEKIGNEATRHKGSFRNYKIKQYLKKLKISSNIRKKAFEAISDKYKKGQKKTITQKRKIINKELDEGGISTGLVGRRGLESQGKRVRYNVSAQEKSSPVLESRSGFASSKKIETTTSVLSRKSSNSVVASNSSKSKLAKSAEKISTGPVDNKAISINQRPG